MKKHLIYDLIFLFLMIGAVLIEDRPASKEKVKLEQKAEKEPNASSMVMVFNEGDAWKGESEKTEEASSKEGLRILESKLKVIPKMVLQISAFRFF